MNSALQLRYAVCGAIQVLYAYAFMPMLLYVIPLRLYKFVN